MANLADIHARIRRTNDVDVLLDLLNEVNAAARSYMGKYQYSNESDWCLSMKREIESKISAINSRSSSGSSGGYRRSSC